MSKKIAIDKKTLRRMRRYMKKSGLAKWLEELRKRGFEVELQE